VRLTYGAGLPFVVSRLSSGQTSLNATELGLVRDAQTTVAAADPLTALLDTDGFGIKTDNLHFDAVGQQQLGNGAALWLLDFQPFLSPPTIARKPGGDFSITLNHAFEGFLYTLGSNGTVQAGGWELGEAKTATTAGETVEFTVTPTPGEDRRFYRVERTIAP
jgi:hypothetical protein